MQYIILIGDSNLSINSIKSIEHYGSTRSYDVKDVEGWFCVDYGADHVFYDCAGASLAEEYEAHELSKLPFSQPNFIVLVYTSETRIKTLLQQDNFLKDIWVDNDHGLIMPISEFIALGSPIAQM